MVTLPYTYWFAKDGTNNTNRIIYRVHFTTKLIHKILTQKNTQVCYSHEVSKYLTFAQIRFGIRQVARWLYLN